MKLNATETGHNTNRLRKMFTLYRNDETPQRNISRVLVTTCFWPRVFFEIISLHLAVPLIGNLLTLKHRHKEANAHYSMIQGSMILVCGFGIYRNLIAAPPEVSPGATAPLVHPCVRYTVY